MSETRLAYLYQQCLTKAASVQEKEELYALLNEPENEALVKSYILELLETPKEMEDISAEKMRSTLETIFATDGNTVIAMDEPPAKARKVYAVSRYTWWAAAAAIMLILISRSGKHPAPGAPDAMIPAHYDVAPGNNRALLTLADGSTVALDSAGNQVIKQGNTAIHQQGGLLQYNTPDARETVQYNTLSTPRGGQFRLKLPDGSGVWLNAGSSITFPTAFTGKERKVTINGEAYFEVVGNSQMPFKVNVNNQAQIEVLGTHFNINAYTNETHINTTLLEGSVKVLKGAESVLLRPGQQAAIDKNNPPDHSILVKTVDMEKVMAWKNGLFDFEDADLKDVMRQLERWYDIEVVYEQQVPDIYFAGKMSKELNLSEILDALQKAGVHFRLEEGRKLIVMQ
ncbi:MAG TPA: FecR family protein [Chitinophaga sp.]